MITLRPWKGSTHEFEVDIILTGVDGRRIRKRVKAPVAGKSNAERWAKALESHLLTQLLAPEPPPERPPAPTFQEFSATFLEVCRADRLGRNTLGNYEHYIRVYLGPVLGGRRLDEVDAADITAIKAGMTAKAHNTMCMAMRTLRRIFNVALARKVIEQVPVEFNVPRRRHRAVIAYSTSEQQSLLHAATELGNNYVVMLLLGLDAGLRCGEMIALQWGDIDLEHGRLIVRRNLVRGELEEAPKGRTEDDVALTARLRDALSAYHHRESKFVLYNAGGRHLGEGDLRRLLRRIVTLAGVAWHGTHILRKTCGTRIADGGGGVAAVAAHLRHKDLKTASRYIDRRGASDSAVKALERVP